MSSSSPSAARESALAKLAAEAARFTKAPEPDSPHPVVRSAVRLPRTPHDRESRASASPVKVGRSAGYVPVAVAPERGNTRPVVPVDGRLHMRMAQSTVDALDEIVALWKSRDPAGLRDLERATLVRIGVAMLLADVAQNKTGGAVGEAVRRALDPVVRHTDSPMPDLSRWVRNFPLEEQGPAEGSRRVDQSVSVGYDSRSPG